MRRAIALPPVYSALALGLVAIVAVWSAAACSSAPSAQARACTARSHLETSLDQLRNFDYTNGTGAELAADLDSARQGLVGLEAAVHLPHNTTLQQLGGVGRIRQLEAELRALSSSVHGSPNVSTYENAVRQRTTEMQQIVGAVSGC
jgi:hypothetical protein